MRALVGGRWRDVLDYHRGPDEYTIQVALWQTLAPLTGVYFQRPRSARLVGNYLREFGVRQVVRKVLSRLGEEGRNEKYVAWGIGVVVARGAGAACREGEPVAFLAPAHPACVERVTAPEGLVVRLPADALRALPAGTLTCLPPAPAGGEGWWSAAAGWSPYSGAPAPDVPLDRLRALAQDALDARPAGDSAPAPLPTPAATVRGARRDAGGRPSAALFGYGNYAKTAVLPGVARFLSVQRVHELDPTQIPPPGRDRWTWDTSPLPPEERYDAWLIAGFHHTHAPLAATALDRGAYAVVEKPVATDREQLARLVGAARASPRLFACFHRRYSAFNDLAIRDLGVQPGERVDYHCIVSEVSLPPLHWYRWPNSRSRLVSNGCHWIDHFLHLNGYARVASSDLFLAADGTLHASASLVNGAVFSMALTERGSERIGLQDHVELRSGDVTVRIQDSGSYVAEGPDRVLRRVRGNRFGDHRRMYRTIARAIAEGRAGDDPDALERSAGLVLDLEDRLSALSASR